MPPPLAAIFAHEPTLSPDPTSREAPTEPPKAMPISINSTTCADAAAADRLSTVRAAARAAAEAMYAAGPGKTDVFDVAIDEDENDNSRRDENGGKRRARKARAAYISRFGAAAYTEMLCAHIIGGGNEVAALEARRQELAVERVQLRWALLQAENAVLKRTVMDLGGSLEPLSALVEMQE